MDGTNADNGKRMPMNTMANGRNASQIRVIPHGIFNPVIAATKVETSYLGGIYPPLSKQHFHRPNHPVENHGNADVPNQRPRVQAFGEQLRFEVLMFEDSGEYICRVPGGVEAKLRLIVERPNIQILPTEIGSHYVALRWNDSLKIRSFERVQVSLQTQLAQTGQIGRIIQLSLYNPWHSYNVVRLRPFTNYTFCLVYSLRQPRGDIENSETLYKTCVDVTTEVQLGFWSSLSPTVVGIFMAFCFLVFSLMCFRAIYLRFYIWHEAKLRARMNQSMSGQSFLSHSSSLPSTNTNQFANGQMNTFDSCSGPILNQTKCQQNSGSKDNAKGRSKRKSGKGGGLLLLENGGENVDKQQQRQTEDIALC